MIRTKYNPWIFVLNGSISVFLLYLGLYVLKEKKVLIAGKLTGHMHKLDYPGYIFVAISFFTVAVFVVMVLIDGRHIKKICEWLLISAFILFVTGVYI